MATLLTTDLPVGPITAGTPMGYEVEFYDLTGSLVDPTPVTLKVKHGTTEHTYIYNQVGTTVITRLGAGHYRALVTTVGSSTETWYAMWYCPGIGVKVRKFPVIALPF